MAVFWLSASAAWANGVIGMKNAVPEGDDSNWLFTSKDSVCGKNGASYINGGIKDCTVGSVGSYGGANASVVSIS